MATSRRRSNTKFEPKQTEEILEETVTIEEVVAEEPQEVFTPAEPVIESIVATDFPQPEEKVEQPAPVAKTPGTPLKAPPKRHPRNIPKFSRHK